VRAEVRRCYKYGCNEPAKTAVPVMVAVTIYCCAKHGDDARDLARTGRPS
jgi:hypothetical protein